MAGWRVLGPVRGRRLGTVRIEWLALARGCSSDGRGEEEEGTRSKDRILSQYCHGVVLSRVLEST